MVLFFFFFFSILSVQLNKLTDLNCEGCTRLSDNAFKHLLLSTLTASILASYADCDGHTRCAEQCSGQQQQSDHAFCERKLSIEDLESTNSTTRQQERTSEPASGLLSSINLSGCWSITDFGLRFVCHNNNNNNNNNTHFSCDSCYFLNAIVYNNKM